MTVRATGLLCEYLVDPPAIDELTPLLSWTLADDGSAERGWRQSGYQILVASRAEDLTPERADRWNSGRVASGATTAIPYAGAPLRSRDPCWWTVRAWDARDESTDWATPARWTMGLLDAADWRADWIGLEETSAPVAAAEADSHGRRALWPTRLAGRQLRREFDVIERPAQATLYIAGLGCHEVWLNGARVGDHIGDPALTNYDRRVCYVAHDVTSMLAAGANALAVALGNGRFFAPRGLPPELPQPRGPNPENWFEEYPTLDWGVPRLLLQLELVHADGSTELIVSDASWRATADGPIRANNEYDGEIHDARRATPGWLDPGFDDSTWPMARMLHGPSGVLVAQAIEPIRVVETLPSVTVEQPTPGRWIVDVGQVVYGRPRIRVRGPRGAEVVIHSANTRRPDGRLRTEDNRAAQNTDVYILAGNAEESWAPAFRGQAFRYLELTAPPEVELIRAGAEVLSTDSRPVSTFTCSNPLVDQLASNIRNGHRTFRRSVPMDPDRDERQGWMGDHQKHSESDAYHFDVAALYRKWLDDIVLEQRPNGQLPELAPAFWPAYDVDLVWPSLAPLLAEWLYDCYADLPLIRRVYQPLVRWLGFAQTLRRADGTWDCNYGDWCDTSTVGYDMERPSGATPRPLIATAYMANNLRIVARFASVLGDDDEARRLGDLAREAGELFNRVFYDPARGIYGNGTQTSLTLPLAFGLVPAADRARVAANLAHDIVSAHQGHVSVGLLGVQWLMQVLTDTGYPEVAYLVASQTSFPSWGYMIEHGATSIWERWDYDAQGSAMNSAALPVLAGNLGSWFHQAVAGIALDATEPGWRRITLRPRPVGDLRSASGTRDAMGGRIESSWRLADGRFTWHVVVPPNTIATAWVPTIDASSVTERGNPITDSPGVVAAEAVPGALRLTLGSGNYQFEAVLPEDRLPVAGVAPVGTGM